jgi:hypothetical protein
MTDPLQVSPDDLRSTSEHLGLVSAWLFGAERWGC